MTNAGWYPDPAGAPDTYRYWDGQSWSQMTTSTPPSGAAPQQPQQPQQPPPSYQQQPQQPQQPPYQQYGAVPPIAPPPPPGHGQWSPGPQPGGHGGGSGGSGKTIGLVIAGVLVLVLLGVAGFFGVRALAGDDDPEADDPTTESSQTDQSDPTDSQSGDPSESSTGDDTSTTIHPTGIQCTGGKTRDDETPDPGTTTLSSSKLTIPRLSGYTTGVGSNVAFEFPDAFVLQYVDVEEYWISLTGVGGLAKANGFDSVDTAAEVIMQCLTSSDRIYKGFTGRTDLTNESITVDGKSAHHIKSEVRVTEPRVTVEGDVVDVIVVDTGDPDEFGLFIGMAAIGRDDLISKNEDVIKAIKVG